jgi:hypothetical protein
MGFDLKRNSQVLSEKDLKLLLDICLKNNVSLLEMEGLLRVEKEYQLKERRFGIYDKLKQILEVNIK